MPLSIKNLTVEITIGGQNIILDSYNINKGLDDLNKTDPLSENLKKGFSFKMQKGTSVSVTVGQLVSWFKTSFSPTQIGTLESDVRGFVNQANKNTPNDPGDTSLDGILLELSELYFSATKNPALVLDFGFALKVTLNDTFYDNLGLDEITNIITVDSIGFSLTYTNN